MTKAFSAKSAKELEVDYVSNLEKMSRVAHLFTE